MKAIDAWIAEQGKPKIGRPEAVRRLVATALGQAPSKQSPSPEPHFEPSPEQLAAIDIYRTALTPALSRAEAIRLLVDTGLRRITAGDADVDAKADD
jgi:hypothetical protein